MRARFAAGFVMLLSGALLSGAGFARAQSTDFSSKTLAEESRSRAETSRGQAIKADAARLAKDVFGAAQAKQAEGDTLMSRRNFAAASQAYQDAARRYMEAGLRAQAVREAKARADDVRARMLAEKQLARTDSPDFKAALAEEKQGISLYEHRAYKEAAVRFRAAETLFAKERSAAEKAAAEKAAAEKAAAENAAMEKSSKSGPWPPEPATTGPSDEPKKPTPATGTIGADPDRPRRMPAAP